MTLFLSSISLLLSMAKANSDVPYKAPSSSYPPFSFYVMGDTPYNNHDANILVHQIAQINKDTSTSFVVHVGDLMNTTETYCRPLYYKRASNIIFNSSVPTVVLPGDNDFLDCPDQNVGMKRFHRHFVDKSDMNMGIGDRLEGFQRQKSRRENFVFLKHNVLCIGLNMNTAKHDIHWKSRERQTMHWFRSNYNTYKHDARAIILFAHSISARSIYNMVKYYVQDSEIPLLFLQGNGHIFKLVRPKQKELQHTFVRITVDQGGIAPPIKVTVHGRGTSSNLVLKSSESVRVLDQNRVYELFSGLITIDRGV